MEFKSPFLQELEWRGLLHQCTPDLDDQLQKGEQIVGYIGYDPTAQSLTIGNLVTIQLLALLQKHGHKPIVLLGGATGRIGDPSGKDAERQLLDLDVLERNIAHQTEIFKSYLNFEGENAAIMVNNYDFYKDMSSLEFLRDVGKQITISYMLSKESVKSRLETGLSFTEFSYQLLQGYDFECLYKQHNCVLQMGGSDQWGNIMTGVDFNRRKGQKVHAVTCPLLTDASGKKIGKSVSGDKIWLSGEMTSPYRYYQFWLNSQDQVKQKMLRTFSMKSQKEIIALEEHDDLNHWKRELAEEMTTRAHGADAFKSAKAVSELLFNKKANAEQLNSLAADDLKIISEEIPSFSITVSEPTNIIDVLTDQAAVFASKAEARRAIKGNSLKVNKVNIQSHEELFNPTKALHSTYFLVEVGKKQKFMLMLA